MIRKLVLPLFLGASIIGTTIVSCDTISNLPGVYGSAPITEGEAANGIRDALSNGISTAITNLGRENGFFGDKAYKLLLPPDAAKVEGTLRDIGLGSQVDRAILQINRAAEDAVGYAKPIFANAIKEMTIQDALGIVRGGNSAATDYFRNKTREQLLQAFRPSIQQSLDRLQATRYYSDIVSMYNKLPTTRNKVSPDLTGYVVGRATDALFDQIEKEEANIRANPAARTTEILKKVFGSI